jgi:TonB family protein
MSTNPIPTDQPSQSGNQRCSVRQRVETLAYVGLGPDNGGVLFDISEGGVAFQGIQPLQKDELLCINFKLPGIDVSMESLAHAAWLNESGKGGGLRFVDLPDDTRSKIRQWFFLQTISRGRREETSASRAHLTPINLESSSAIHLVASPEIEPGPSHKGTSDSMQQSLISTAAASRAAEADTSTATPVPIGLTKTSLLRNPSSMTERSGTWITRRERRLLMCFGVVAILGAVFFGGETNRVSTTEAQAPDDVHLGLKLERSGPNWEVSWDKNADVLLEAVGGDLSITDGQKTKQFDLDPGELRSGHIVYTPVTDYVVARLRVARGSLGQPISESVRVVTGSAPLPSSETKAAGPDSRETSSSRTPAGVATPSAPVEELSPKRPAAQRPMRLDGVPAKAATQPKVDKSKTGNSARSAATRKAATPSPKKISRTSDSLIPSITLPLGSESPQRATAILPEMATPVSYVPVPQPRGSKLDPAQLLSRKDPVYPAEAKAARISGRVELRFTIGTDGNVHGVSVAAGNPLLARAAVEAVQRWHYTPARLAGTPVQSEANTAFVFQPN